MSEALVLNEANFKEEVMESDKPVLIDFWAEWCGPCKRLGPVIDELAGDFSDRVKVAKVNVDDNQNLATEYNVTSIPFVAIFKDGQIVDQQLGLAPKETFSEKLNALL